MLVNTLELGQNMCLLHYREQLRPGANTAEKSQNEKWWMNDRKEGRKECVVICEKY